MSHDPMANGCDVVQVVETYLITGFGTTPMLQFPELEAFTGCCRCETASAVQVHALQRQEKRPHARLQLGCGGDRKGWRERRSGERKTFLRWWTLNGKSGVGQTAMRHSRDL